jgi:hypothetical protein
MTGGLRHFGCGLLAFTVFDLLRRKKLPLARKDTFSLAHYHMAQFFQLFTLNDDENVKSTDES